MCFVREEKRRNQCLRMKDRIFAENSSPQKNSTDTSYLFRSPSYEQRWARSLHYYSKQSAQKMGNTREKETCALCGFPSFQFGSVLVTFDECPELVYSRRACLKKSHTFCIDCYCEILDHNKKCEECTRAKFCVVCELEGCDKGHENRCCPFSLRK